MRHQPIIRQFLCTLLVAAIAALQNPHAALAGRTDTEKVLAVGADTITIQNSPHAGLKISDVDANGVAHQKGPSNVAVFKVNMMTEITVDGLRTTLHDVRPGMKVDLRIGIDPTEAAAIVATTVVPAKPPEPVKNKDGTQPNPTPLVAADTVLSKTEDTITIGNPGRSSSRAYRVTPHTRIRINGVPGTLSEVSIGMEVHVEAFDPQVARSIEARDTKD